MTDKKTIRERRQVARTPLRNTQKETAERFTPEMRAMVLDHIAYLDSPGWHDPDDYAAALRALLAEVDRLREFAFEVEKARWPLYELDGAVPDGAASSELHPTTTVEPVLTPQDSTENRGVDSEAAPSITNKKVAPGIWEHHVSHYDIGCGPLDIPPEAAPLSSAGAPTNNAMLREERATSTAALGEGANGK